MVQATGIVVIRKLINGYCGHRYYKYIDSMAYKSKDERMKVMRRLCLKYAVNNYSTVISVIPDEIKIDVDNVVGKV